MVSLAYRPPPYGASTRFRQVRNGNVSQQHGTWDAAQTFHPEIIMRERCFRLDPDEGVVVVPADEVRLDGGPGTGVYWVDLADAAPREVASRMQQLGVAPSTRSLLPELHTVPRVMEVEGAVILQLPALNTLQDLQPLYITVVVTPRIMLTTHEASPFIERMVETGPSPVWEAAPSAAGLVTILLDLTVEDGDSPPRPCEY